MRGTGSPFGAYGGGFGGAGAGGNVRYEFRTGGDAGEFSDFFRVFFGEEAGPRRASGGRGSRPTGGLGLRGHPGRDGHRRPIRRRVPARPGPVLPRARSTRRRPRSPSRRPTTARPGWSRSTASGSRSRSRPGADTGTKVKLTGRGPGGGDLIVVVRVTPDPTFTRRGADLERELPLTLEEALLGARGHGRDAQGSGPADDPGRDPAGTDLPAAAARGCRASRRPATATCTSRPGSSCRPTCPTRPRAAARTLFDLIDQPDPR